MARRYTGENVFDQAINRIIEAMENGDKIVVSFSGGKDSCVLLECALLAAQYTGYGKVDVVMRDEEALFPGSYEYADRVAQRHDQLTFHHFIAKQPIINCFNRESPYWWVFDDLVDPDDWVRKPPHWEAAGAPALTPGTVWYPESWGGGRVEVIPELHIEAMVTTDRFPTPEGKDLIDLIGLRVSESRGRLFGIYSSGGWLTKPRTTKAANTGVRKGRPIFDWSDADVWKAVLDNRWDYNEAYNVLHRLGAPRHDLRIAPPTMNAAGTRVLARARQGWPRWFDRLENRCPGVKTAAQFGIRSVTPMRHRNESWEACFQRECIDTAPAWAAERASIVREKVLRAHSRHSTAGLPEIAACWQCAGDVGSWKNMAQYLYLGDPFALKTGSMLKPIEPEFFREGMGTWGGSPAFA
jgi:predicted phosphoadenosine phosphosulfate sulfurtransferase